MSSTENHRIKHVRYQRSKLLILVTALISSYSAAQIQNFGEPNTKQLRQAIQNKSLHIIQMGDSHTAADVMTGALRTSLQAELGNGGMGWGMPMYFTGQRLANYGYDNTAFSPISSRTQPDANYTLGGFLAIPKQSGATLTIKPKLGATKQRFLVSLRQGATDSAFIGTDATGHQFSIEAPQKNNQWQIVSFTATPPFTIIAQNANHSAIGGWWGFNEHNKGAVVSALGINGAELSYWNRWRNWQNELTTIRPQLLILAYGTNEAYNNVDPTTVKQILKEKIEQIRKASPQTAIMIIAAPESLKNTLGSCGTRPTYLSAIQQVQREVAQQQKTLFWDWQHAMGGNCSMKSWITQGKAARDGVHFSIKGYTIIGENLAKDLLSLSEKATYNQPQNPTSPATSNHHFIPSTHHGFGKICSLDSDGKEQCVNIQ